MVGAEVVTADFVFEKQQIYVRVPVYDLLTHLLYAASSLENRDVGQRLMVAQGISIRSSLHTKTRVPCAKFRSPTYYVFR